MALVTTKRNVDVLPGQAAPTVFHCSQHDVGATIILGLVNAGGSFAIPSGVTAIIQGSCSNGAVFTPVTATVSGSDITFNLSDEMTSIAGPTVCEAVLSKDADVLGTANFILDVEPSAMGSDTPPVFADAAWLWMVDKMGSETVFALGDKTVIDAINEKADQSDVTALSDAKLDKNQGTANAGKYLKVGADGNVETADLDVTTDKTLSIADKAADAKAVGDELDDLKADLTQSVDNLSNAIDFNTVSGWTSGYYATGSSYTNVDVESITANPIYLCSYMLCTQGDVFYYTGYGSSSARPWAFLKSNGDIISKGSAGSFSKERIVAPANATTVIFNASKEVLYSVAIGDPIITKVTANKTAIDSVKARIKQTNVDIPWEVGNIAFAQTGPTYKYDRDTRVRTPKGYGIRLNAGDVIGMTDYTDAGFYCQWYDDNSGYHYTSAKYADYVITQDGIYSFLLRHRTEVSLNGNLALGEMFFVRSNVTANELYSESCDYTDRKISYSESGLNYHLFKQAKPRFAMHRGYQTLAPENTSPAFELAGQNGAWGIETDIYETTDGYFVCHHDATVDRMTDGTGNISSMTLAQVEALIIDAGANIEQYPNLKIPTLETYLSICRRYGCVGLIEIKSVNDYASLCNLIRAKGMEDSVVFLISDYKIAPTLRYNTRSAVVNLGYTTSDNYWVVLAVSPFENMGADFAESTITDETYVAYAHARNLPVIVWTVDSESRADELFKWGVDVITTNSIPHFSE